MHLIEPTTDDTLLVNHYRLHWTEIGIHEDDIRSDWREEAFRFIRVARSRDGFSAFVAKENGLSIGTACCQLAPRVFPAFRKVDATRIGYIWGLYVTPKHRFRGVGEELVTTCMSHLRTLGCGRVMLHASERSATLYKRLGFEPTEELVSVL